MARLQDILRCIRKHLDWVKEPWASLYVPDEWGKNKIYHFLTTYISVIIANFDIGWEFNQFIGSQKEERGREVLHVRHRSNLKAWAYLATHEPHNFGGDTPNKGATPKIEIFKLTDFNKQIVYVGVIDPVESNLALFLS